jgi:hypothetical protein
MWANAIYSRTATLALNSSSTSSNNAKYVGPITLGANAGIVAAGGFQLVGAIVLGMRSVAASTQNAIYPESITLACTEDFSGTGNLIIPDSITLGTTVNIPLSGTTTWNLETMTWEDDGFWGYAPSIAVPVTATLTQVISDVVGGEDVEKIASAIMGLESGVSATGILDMPVTATLDSEQNIKFNINFEESATLSATSGISSSSNFLWNNEAEDTGTTWTKVSDPDE